MTLEEMKRKFPSNFPCELLVGVDAKEEEISGYRVCRTGRVEEASFLPTHLDVVSKTKEFDPEDIGNYSVSLYEKYKHANDRYKFMKKKNPPAILAIGVTAPECGPCQRTKYRTGTKSSHIDWWLYKDAQPHVHFREVDNSTDNLEK